MTRKNDQSPAGLCNQATDLGNIIAVRMLEYLGTTKHQAPGYRELATEFLDTSQILWSINAGLAETRRWRSMPVEMMHELVRKFRVVYDVFLVINQVTVKYLENSRKHGIARFEHGFRMKFIANGDIQKLRAQLAISRDALKMSALVFRWSLGDAKLVSKIGIGYTGLAAALERFGGDWSPNVSLSAQDDGDSQGTLVSDKHHIKAIVPDSKDIAPAPPGNYPFYKNNKDVLSEPPTLSRDRALSLGQRLRKQHQDDAALLKVSQPGQRNSRLVSVGKIQVVRSAKSPHSTRLGRAGSTGEETLMEELLLATNINDVIPQQGAEVASLRRSQSVSRWKAARHSSGVNAAHLKDLLVAAVREKKHDLLEQVLDRGVHPDSETRYHILRDAVLNHDLESIRLLLTFGADTNRIDNSDGTTALTTAVRIAFADALKLLLNYGADPVAAAPDAPSALSIAVSENKADVVQLLLVYLDPNQTMNDGNTIFISIMTQKTPQKLIEQVLTTKKVDIDRKSTQGRTALFEAVQSGRPDLVSTLLDHGADPNLAGPKHILWPATCQPGCLRVLLARGADADMAPGCIELATSINNGESVRVLLDAGVDPNIKKDGIYTPLCSAIRDDRRDLVDLLLARGADPNVPACEYPAFQCITHKRAHLLPHVVAAGADLTTPPGIVEMAVRHNDRSALDFLLQAGADPNARCLLSGGHTPLTTAIREGRSVDILEALLAAGANPCIRGHNELPLHMAVRDADLLQRLLPHVSDPATAFRGLVERATAAGRLDCVKVLLAAGASVEDRNGGVFSPLTTAIREERKDIVRFLLEEGGADVNAPGDQLPLIKAIRRYVAGDTEVLRLLLHKGADVNLVYRGYNAVLQAVENEDAEVLSMLVEMGDGIDLGVCDEAGRTVLEVVRARAWDEGEEILLGGVEKAQARYSSATEYPGMAV